MRYSFEPRDICNICNNVKGYGFLSFAKNMGKNLAINMVQSFLIVLKNLQQNAVKTASKRAIQKAAEPTNN